MVQKTVEVPQVQHVDKIIDVPVVKQVEVPQIQKIPKTVEVPQIQYIDKVVDIPVVKQRQVPMVQKIQKTVDVPQIQYLDKIVDVPVVKHVEVPQVQTIEKVVEIPQVQVVEKVVEVPQVETVAGGQSVVTAQVQGGRQVANTEHVEVTEIGPPLPAVQGPAIIESAPAPSISLGGSIGAPAGAGLAMGGGLSGGALASEATELGYDGIFDGLGYTVGLGGWLGFSWWHCWLRRVDRRAASGWHWWLGLCRLHRRTRGVRWRHRLLGLGLGWLHQHTYVWAERSWWDLWWFGRRWRHWWLEPWRLHRRARVWSGRSWRILECTNLGRLQLCFYGPLRHLVTFLQYSSTSIL